MKNIKIFKIKNISSSYVKKRIEHHVKKIFKKYNSESIEITMGWDDFKSNKIFIELKY